jgi:hypothetical protein
MDLQLAEKSPVAGGKQRTYGEMSGKRAKIASKNWPKMEMRDGMGAISGQEPTIPD